MKTLRLTKWQILLPVIGWGLLFLGLSAFNYNRFEVLNIVGFLFLTIVPGLLTLLVIRLKGLNFWGYAGFTLAFSLLELMLVALLGNTFLPFAGIAQPLTKFPVLLEIYLLVGVLAATVWLRVKEIEIPIKNSALFDRFRDWVFSFVPVIFPVLAIFGTISLNDGGGSLLTMIMLGGIGVYLIFLIIYNDGLDENTTPTGIFFIALSMLLMTSLRGWYITGHDIQAEYKVFELAKNAGIWSIAAYQDAYNACLSITILPTVFSSLLNIPDPYVFKFFFQIFFAFCPVMVYLTNRQWTNRLVSLLGTIYFIAFLTFFTDMPFLVRQEVAFLFYSLMLYIILRASISLSTRRWLFMAMGIGVIISHYSTTYTVLFIFGLVVIARPLFVWLFNKYKDRKLFKNSALIPPGGDSLPKKPKITFLMIAVLFALSFVWTTLITNTSSSATSVITQTFAAVKDGFAGDNRSIDAVSLLSFSTPNQDQEMQNYITQTADPVRAAAAPGTYYSDQTVDQYNYTALSDETVPVTTVGMFVESLHINIVGIMDDLGRVLAKLLELLAPIGMIYFLTRKSIIEHVDDEIYLICVFYLVFIAMNIILPVLSTDYGIYRAMQQALFIMAPIIVAGSIVMGEGFIRGVQWCLAPFRKKRLTMESVKRWSTVFGIVLVITFFWYSTSFMRQIFGGNTAVLHLSDSGDYYNDYLIQTTEVYGVNWLTSVANNAEANGVRLLIQTDRYSKTTFASITTLDSTNTIFPGLVTKDAYVFLNPATTLKDRAVVLYNDDEVTYQYPIQFLADNKNLIYNNGGAEVYR